MLSSHIVVFAAAAAGSAVLAASVATLLRSRAGVLEPGEGYSRARRLFALLVCTINGAAVGIMFSLEGENRWMAFALRGGAVVAWGVGLWLVWSRFGALLSASTEGFAITSPTRTTRLRWADVTAFEWSERKARIEVASATRRVSIPVALAARPSFLAHAAVRVPPGAVGPAASRLLAAFGA